MNAPCLQHAAELEPYQENRRCAARQIAGARTLWAPPKRKARRRSRHRCQMPSQPRTGVAPTKAWNTVSQIARRAAMTCSTSEAAAAAAPRLRPSLGEFAPACFELLFHRGRLARPTNALPLRLRSGRTKLATVCSALRAFARQGHPRSTSIDPGSPGRRPLKHNTAGPVGEAI